MEPMTTAMATSTVTIPTATAILHVKAVTAVIPTVTPARTSAIVPTIAELLLRPRQIVRMALTRTATHIQTAMTVIVILTLPVLIIAVMEHAILEKTATVARLIVTAGQQGRLPVVTAAAME
jgi:hypothetical protein